MMYLKRAYPAIIVQFIMMDLAACRGTTNYVFGKYNATTPTPTTSNSSSSSNALIKTSTVTVDGKSETILTDAKGKTLYYFTPDTATTTACTGSCAKKWPPLVATGSSAPASTSSLQGKLTTLTTANGNQIEYNGHFLYTFAGDGGPGQTNGNKLFDKWFVATPNLK